MNGKTDAYSKLTDKPAFSPSTNARPDFRADVFDSMMSRLEAFGDELARQARTKEQKALAEEFGGLVGEVDWSIRYIAEVNRQRGPPGATAAERLASPGQIADSQDTAQTQQPARDKAMPDDRLENNEGRGR